MYIHGQTHEDPEKIPTYVFKVIAQKKAGEHTLRVISLLIIK